MGKISERKQLLQQLESTIIEMIRNDLVESPEFNDILEFYLEVESRRFIKYKNKVPKQDAYMSIFFQYDDVNFRQIARMDKDSFIKILGRIRDHQIFKNNSIYSTYIMSNLDLFYQDRIRNQNSYQNPKELYIFYLLQMLAASVYSIHPNRCIYLGKLYAHMRYHHSLKNRYIIQSFYHIGLDLSIQLQDGHHYYLLRCRSKQSLLKIII
jgi:hypothetical protein